MEEILKANIFFVITSIAVVFVSVAFMVACAYLVGILRDIKYVSRKVKEGSDLMAADLSEIRTDVKQDIAEIRRGLKEDLRVTHLFDFLGSLFKSTKKGRVRKRKE